MSLASKVLLCSLLIVWISVFVKYKSFGFLQTASSSEVEKTESTRRFRFRQTFRKGVQKIVDKTNRKEVSIDNGEFIYDEEYDSKENSRRVSNSLKNGYRKIKSKVRPSTTRSFQPMYRFDPKEESNYLNVENNYQPEDFQVPYKPGEMKHLTMIALAKNIIRSGNYKPNGFNNHIYQLGYYNNYNYRPDEYANATSSICSNYLEYGGIVFGQFLCPTEGYNITATQCCGAVNEEHCCEPKSTSKKATQENPHLIYLYLLIFIPTVIFIIIMVLFVYIARRKKTLFGGFYLEVDRSERGNKS